MKLRIQLVATILAVNLTGCSKEPPKCSDPDTLNLIRQIIVEKLGANHPAAKLSQNELEGKLLILNPRADSYDEKVRKYSCSGTLIAPMKVENLQYQLDIEYESQLDDNKKHLVVLKNMRMGDLIGISQALINNINADSRASHGSKDQSPAPQSQSPAPSNTTIVGNWKGQLEGDGEMRIKPTPTGYDASLGVSSPGCSGSIEGSGSLSGGTLTLTKKENDQTCTITVKFTGNTAEVDENNCSFYHGAACSFYGTLKKVD